MHSEGRESSFRRNIEEIKKFGMFFHIIGVEEIEVQLRRVTVCVPSKAQSVQPV
ncbi:MULTISPECIES: hypothetical protein [Petrotoga]|uniref:hypothetical protein n=1 Tax=Petrotoga TaxID=28236 RepID=UPI001304E518|nr:MULTISPECIES: hypothetical protein [Petrotoga]